MITRSLKLKPTKQQEETLNEWLFMLTGVWNWAIRKIELDAKDKIYYSKYDFMGLVSGHSKKCGLPALVLSEMMKCAYMSWRRCFKKISGKPRFKGNRNKLNSIPFRKTLYKMKENSVCFTGLGVLKFHKQDIPYGKIGSGRIIKRASGWYLCIHIHAEPNKIPITGNGAIGIDPGFKDLITLSNGNKIDHPRELEVLEKRLGQAQRGKNKKLTAIINERIKKQRKDRNHKLSRDLVSKYSFIAFSKDTHKSISKRFGKSVGSSAHYQLQQMLSYKCCFSGRKYIEVESYKSTKTCSNCGLESGPTGLSGLKVRNWVCSCGAEHDRDVNAAMNTLNSGLGISHENVVRRVRNPNNKGVQSVKYCLINRR